MPEPKSQKPVAGAAAVMVALALSGALLWRVDPAGLLNTWYLSRAAGLVAYGLLFGSVALGLLQPLGMLRGLTVPLTNLEVHEHLSLWAVYVSLYHALILIWDQYVPFSLVEVLLPFASDYESAWVSLGIVALYLMLAVTVSTYLRGRMTPQRWRAIHLASLVGFLFALVHGVAMGTDTGHPVVAYVYRFTGIAVGVLAVGRLLQAVRARYARASGRG